MDRAENYWKGSRTRRISRRSALGLMGAGTLAAWLAACGGADKGSSSGSAPAPSTSANAAPTQLAAAQGTVTAESRWDADPAKRTVGTLMLTSATGSQAARTASDSAGMPAAGPVDLVDPAEVADAVLALVGDAFRGVTGSDVLVDGGFAALGGL